MTMLSLCFVLAMVLATEVFPVSSVPLVEDQHFSRSFWPAYRITKQEFQAANGSTLSGWKQEWELLQSGVTAYDVLYATAALLELRELVLDDPDGLTANWGLDRHPCDFSSVICNHHSVVVGVDFSSVALHDQLAALDRRRDVKPVMRLKKLPDGPAWVILGQMSLKIMRFTNIRLESHVLPDWSDYVHLRELSLGNVGLEGTLPASLGNLRALRHLDLHNNRFHGSLPADWGLMENLKFLDLSLPRMDLAARLVSSLPVSWKDLDKLQVLDLRNQNIHGPLPGSWASMPALEVLSLANTRVSGQLPSVWSALRNLTTLDVSGTLLQGELPQSWGAMHNLSSLDLRKTSVSFSPPTTWSSMCKGHRTSEDVPLYIRLPRQGAIMSSILEDGQINICRPHSHMRLRTGVCITAVLILIVFIARKQNAKLNKASVKTS